MKRLALLLVLACTSLVSQAQEIDPGAWIYRYVLAEWRPDDSLMPILDGIAMDTGSQRPETIDLFADFLVLHADDTHLDEHEISGLVGLLARAKSGRYRDAMGAAGPRIKFSKPRAVADSYAAVYRRRPDVNVYAPTGFDASALRAHFEQDALAYHPDESMARKLVALPDGSPLRDVFGLAGVPQAAEIRQVKLSANTKFRRLLIYYRATARLVFAPDEGTGWVLQSVVADPLAFEDDMPYRRFVEAPGQPDDARLRMIQLVSGSVLAKKEAIESSMKSPTPVPIEFLDTAAQYVIENSRAPPPDEVADETLAWATRLLVERGGQRYANVIQMASKSGGSRTWRQTLPKIHKVDGVLKAAYAPGSVSLSAQAAKYPSPYPEPGFTSGRL